MVCAMGRDAASIRNAGKKFVSVASFSILKSVEQSSPSTSGSGSSVSKNSGLSSQVSLIANVNHPARERAGCRARVAKTPDKAILNAGVLEKNFLRD